MMSSNRIWLSTQDYVILSVEEINGDSVTTRFLRVNKNTGDVANSIEIEGKNVGWKSFANNDFAFISQQVYDNNIRDYINILYLINLDTFNILYKEDFKTVYIKQFSFATSLSAMFAVEDSTPSSILYSLNALGRYDYLLNISNNTIFIAKNTIYDRLYAIDYDIENNVISSAKLIEYRMTTGQVLKVQNFPTQISGHDSKFFVVPITSVNGSLQDLSSNYDVPCLLFDKLMDNSIFRTKNTLNQGILCNLRFDGDTFSFVNLTDVTLNSSSNELIPASLYFMYGPYRVFIDNVFSGDKKDCKITVYNSSNQLMWSKDIPSEYLRTYYVNMPVFLSNYIFYINKNSIVCCDLENGKELGTIPIGISLFKSRQVTLLGTIGNELFYCISKDNNANIYSCYIENIIKKQ